MLGLNLAIEGYDLFDVWLNATKSSPVIPDKLEANLPFLLHKTFDRSLVVAWEFDQQTVSLLSSPIVKASVKMEADSFLFFFALYKHNWWSGEYDCEEFSLQLHLEKRVGLLWTMHGEDRCFCCDRGLDVDRLCFL